MLGIGLLSVLSKVFEKFVNNELVDHFEESGLFSNFQYGFKSSGSTADQIFYLQFYLIELLWLLIGLMLLELWHYLIYPKLFTGFSMLIFMLNSNVMGFLVEYSALFCLFSVKESFGWF